MEIKTKLFPGQLVYLLFMDKIHEVKIDSIGIQIDYQANVYIKYHLHNNPVGGQYTKVFLEKELHATKKLLLDSL